MVRPPANTTMARIMVANSGVRIEPLYVVWDIFVVGMLPFSSARPRMCADVVRFCMDIDVIVL